MKSIKTKIIAVVLVVGLFIALSMGVCAAVFNNLAANDILDKTTTEIAVVASEHIEFEIQFYKSILTELGCDSSLSDASLSDEEKKSIMSSFKERHGLDACGIMSLDGKDIVSGKN